MKPLSYVFNLYELSKNLSEVTTFVKQGTDKCINKYDHKRLKLALANANS